MWYKFINMRTGLTDFCGVVNLAHKCLDSDFVEMVQITAI